MNMIKLSKYARKQKGKRVCAKKVLYLTRQSAWQKSLFLFTTFGDFQTPYQCKYCKLFHLTQKQRTQASKFFVEGLARWFSLSVEEMEEILSPSHHLTPIISK